MQIEACPLLSHHRCEKQIISIYLIIDFGSIYLKWNVKPNPHLVHVSQHGFFQTDLHAVFWFGSFLEARFFNSVMMEIV